MVSLENDKGTSVLFFVGGRNGMRDARCEMRDARCEMRDILNSEAEKARINAKHRGARFNL
ncbi:hypothetical protein VCHA53O466_220031 [Vibrio chagasii]|nr:hypothetical protein VCHA53O466_220031 [Vibrio chagasii]